MKRIFFLGLVLSALPGYPLWAQCPQLIWSDEFNGSTLDQTKWTYEIGDGCDIGLCQWGTGEIQWYTSQPDNTVVSEGTLKIIARKQTIQTRAYSSARIKSLLKGDIKFGRIEARMKMPKGQGIWPAFWMLPTDRVYGIWPQSGEIDIMEYLGHEPNKIHGTLHFGQLWPNNASTTKSFIIQQSDFNAAFHDYALEWTDQHIKWFIDGYLYSTKTRADLGSQRWPFDQKFHFLLNLAIGGPWAGSPNSSTIFPQTFEIDYVRAYDMVGLAFLDGPNQVLPNQKSVNFSLKNVPNGSTIEWSTPVGVKVISGQTSANITVDWAGSGGVVTAIVKNACSEYKFALAISILPVLVKDIVLENFDQVARISKSSSSGILTEDVSNPAANGVNSSALCGRYTRNSGSLYDILVYDISDIKFGADFVLGEKKLYLDIFTAAPVGTEILLQLEDKNQAQGSNYPVGRHSRYTVKTTKQNEWERLPFTFLDRPSSAVSDFAINQLILLFAPNTQTGATYYLDNFEIYSKTTLPLRSNANDQKVRVFPNPTTDEITIQTNGDDRIRTVKFINLQGITIDSKVGNPSSQLVYKAGLLTPGIYVAVISLSSGQSVSVNFVKK